MNVYKSSTADIRSLRTLIREHGLGHTLPQRAQTRHAVAPTGIEQLDIRLGGGLLRGAICEVIGPCSSGRTGLLLAALARCTRAGEIAAYVDATDCLDQRSAEQAGVELEKLLWIRCNAEGRLCGPQGAWGHAPSDDAWQAANLIAAAGGFGVVAIDLGGLSERQLGRWQKRAWMRLKHAVEGSSTTLAVLAERHVAGSAADMVLRLQRERTAWEGLLEGIGLQVEVVKDRAHREDGKAAGRAA